MLRTENQTYLEVYNRFKNKSKSFYKASLVALFFILSTTNGFSAESYDFVGMPSIPTNAGKLTAQLSPDGSKILYVVQDYRDVLKPALTQRILDQSSESDCRGADLWMVDLPKDGKSQPKPSRVTSLGDNWSPSWSPDGSKIAFVSNRDGSPKLWIISSKGGKAKRVSDQTVSVAFSLLRWSADSRLLLYHNLAGGNPKFKSIAPPQLEDKRAQVRVLSADGKSIPLPIQPPNPAALIVDIKTGKSSTKEMLWPTDMGGSTKHGVAWVVHQKYTKGKITYSRTLDQFTAPNNSSPNSKPVAKPFNFDSLGPAANQAQLRHLKSQGRNKPPFILTSGGRTMIALAANKLWQITLGSSKAPVILKDGKQQAWTNATSLYLQKSTKTVVALGKNKLWTISLSNSGVKEIALPVSDFTKLSKDATRLVTVGKEGFRFWQIKDGSLKLEFDAGSVPAVIENLQISADGTSASFVAEGPQTPRDVWAAKVGLTARNLSKLNSHMKPEKLGQVQQFQYKGPEGKNRHALAVLPVGYQKGKKYPTIMLLYPSGRYLSSPSKFALGDDQRVANPHFFAANGFVVVAANLNDGRSKRIPQLSALVNAAADAAIQHGWSDPNRIGLYGQSDGGFTVNAVITQTNRYKAAVSVAGYANYTSRWCSLDDSGTAYGIFSLMTSWGSILMGTPMKKTQNFIDHSPIFQMDKVRTPLLLLHGRMDQAVPYEQSDEVFVALRASRQKVEYALYEGEGHSPPDWTYPHQLDASKRLLKFFKTYLQP
ncbi:MAG: prolyl oligopeptidase family serine peptidase [Lentisphaeraceae bacterium]|nr:prolyl oligopeptidase family serine peptidase [Lentisphaeraceae bacterium]